VDVANGESSGDLVVDAQLVVIALEHACALVSFDRDSDGTPVAEQRPDPPA
jgi:predicted nucleic acid-binding protein